MIEPIPVLPLNNQVQREPSQAAPMPRKSKFGVNMTALARQHGMPLSTFRDQVKKGKISLEFAQAAAADGEQTRTSSNATSDARIDESDNLHRKSRRSSDRRTTPNKSADPVDQTIRSVDPSSVDKSSNQANKEHASANQSIDPSNPPVDPSRPVDPYPSIRPSVDQPADLSNDPTAGPPFASADPPAKSNVDFLRGITTPIAFGGASIAACFSVTGLMEIFPARTIVTVAGFSVTSITVFGVALEIFKFLGAAWVGRGKDIMDLGLRRWLILGVITLAVINAASVFGNLNAARQSTIDDKIAPLKVELARVETEIKIAEDNVAQAQKRIDDFDKGVRDMTREQFDRGHLMTAGTIIAKSDKVGRDPLVQQRDILQAKLPPLRSEQARLKTEIDKVENGLGVFSNLAKVIAALPWLSWVHNDVVVQILILAMTLCCDPLAILFVMAAARRSP